MDLSCTTLGLLFAAALVAGFVDSIAGGGGIITIPTLLAIGLPPHLALGTNKLQACFGSLTAALNYRRGNIVRFRTLTLGIVCTALGALAGTLSVSIIPADLLKRVIPVLLVIVFVYLLCNPRLGEESRMHGLTTWLFQLVFGLAIGFYDGFFGPGTGSFWTFALVLWLGQDLTRATGQSKVLNFTSNLVSLAAFLIGGHVLWSAGLLMGAGQLLGALLGSHLVLKRGTRFVRIGFLCVVAATIGKLVWSTYR